MEKEELTKLVEALYNFIGDSDYLFEEDESIPEKAADVADFIIKEYGITF